MLAYAQAHTFAHTQNFRNENFLKGVENQLRRKVKQKKDASVEEVEKWGKEPEADAQKAYLGAREKKIAVFPLLVPPSLPPLFSPSLLLSSCCSLLLLVHCVHVKCSTTKQSALSCFILFKTHTALSQGGHYNQSDIEHCSMGIGCKKVGILDVGSLGPNFTSILELILWQQGPSVAWLGISKGFPHMAGTVKICRVLGIEN